MTAEDAAFLEGCGFARVILERALSIDEIRDICRATHDIDLECFVHGAICVGYSGRCFLSRSMSPRSGNRGECSQPCRLPYDLTDAAGRTVIAGKHLLSVRDMDLSQHLEEMMDAGVTSFKIEGRLKDVRYIKNVVSYYRDRLDGILARRWRDYTRSSCGRSEREFEPDPSKSFTRGATEYMFSGKSRGVASFDTPKAVGEYVGRVTGIAEAASAWRARQRWPRATASALFRPRGLRVRTSTASRGRRWSPTAWRVLRSARRYTATTTTASRRRWTAAVRAAR